MRWQDGYPCDSGSTDGQDSARLAGLMALFNHPDAVSCDEYVDVKDAGQWTYWRHPEEKNKYPFSRDQIVPLFAGLYSQFDSLYVETNYNPPNGDYISPSVRDHFRICALRKPTLLGQFWLWIDVLWSAFVKPLDEPNQLISMLMVHPSKRYLWLWTYLNPIWRESIRLYWISWRMEPELAALMISRIEHETRKETN